LLRNGDEKERERELGQKRILEGGTWWRMGIACLLGGGFVISTSRFSIYFFVFKNQ